MSTRYWMVGLTLALGLWVGGCENHNRPADLRAEPAPFLTETRVQFEDNWTADHVKVTRLLDAERLTGGLLKVTVTLRNLEKENLWCDIRTQFLDKNGHVIDKGNWEPFKLDRSTVTDYSYTSMNADAADYQIIIKGGRKTQLNRP
jgi:hypothetical protein